MGKLTYLSHSAWLIESGQHTIAIDPFLEGNPMAKIKPADIKADYIITTIVKRKNKPTQKRSFLHIFCKKTVSTAQPIHKSITPQQLKFLLIMTSRSRLNCLR